MNYPELLEKTRHYINDLYTKRNDERFLFHNLSNALCAFDAAKKIASQYKLTDNNTFIVCAAALFRDTGFLFVQQDDYIEKSTSVAHSFLTANNTPEEEILQIVKCIYAAQQPASPVNLNEEIVCDAVTFYFGTEDFKEKTRLLKKEKETLSHAIIDIDEWRSRKIKMLKEHTYFTNYCRNLLDKQKARNLEKLQKKQQQINDQKQSDSALVTEADESNINKTTLINEDKINQDEIDRGKKLRASIKTKILMYRINSANSLKISEMADSKAHIMITVNSIIIGLLIRHIDDRTSLAIPTFFLLAVCVTTIVYSILATRARVAKGVFRKDQVDRKTVNLLYFGSFFNMDLKDYDEGMREMLDDDEFTYNTMIKDLYWQGKVLGRKYRLLHVSYSVFMYGLIASVIAYGLAMFF